MKGHLRIEDIAKFLRLSAGEFSQYCRSLTDEQFFAQPEGKWSPAQQVKHLVTSARMSRLAFSLPRFMVRLIGGRPNRPSRSYDELVTKYNTKLAAGGRASGRFVPKPIPASIGKEKLMNEFDKANERLVQSMLRRRTEAQLDQYLAPHPLLGKITLRELGYFTIHHTHHHLSSIQLLTGHGA